MRELLAINTTRAKKDQNRLKSQIQAFKAKHGNTAKIAEVLNVNPDFISLTLRLPYKRNPLRAVPLKRKVSDVEKATIAEICSRQDISMEVPYRKHAGKKFLKMRQSDVYGHYKAEATERGGRVVSERTFIRHMPSNIRTSGKTPSQGCQCDRCLNNGTIASKLASHLKGVSRKPSDNVIKSLCSPDRAANSSSRTESGYMTTFKLDCIDGECDKCGTKAFEDFVRENNQDVDWQKKVEFKLWQTKTYRKVNKDGKSEKSSKIKEVHFEETLQCLLNRCITGLGEYCRHLFDLHHQASDFERCKKNITAGDVLFVCDFNQNYSHKKQVEPQSTHWSHPQSTVHSSVAFFLCPTGCGKMAHADILVTSDDKKHDHYAVKTYTEVMKQKLEEMGVPVKRMIRFSDNCSGQYKSKNTFYDISAVDYPYMVCFYCAKHGKSCADGASGRAMQSANIIKSSGQDIPQNAQGLADVLTRHVNNTVPRTKYKEQPRGVTDVEKMEIKSFLAQDDVSKPIMGLSVDAPRRMVCELKDAHRSYTKHQQLKAKRALSYSTFTRIFSETALLKRDPDEPPLSSLDQEQSRVDSPICNESQQQPVERDRPPESDCPMGFKHVQQHFICVNDIDRSEPMKTLRSVVATRKLHCVRNTGFPGQIELRINSCTCNKCLNGSVNDTCPTYQHTGPMSFVNLLRGKARYKGNMLWPELPYEPNLWKTKKGRPITRKRAPPPRRERVPGTRSNGQGISPIKRVRRRNPRRPKELESSDEEPDDGNTFPSTVDQRLARVQSPVQDPIAAHLTPAPLTPNATPGGVSPPLQDLNSAHLTPAPLTPNATLGGVSSPLQNPGAAHLTPVLLIPNATLGGVSPPLQNPSLSHFAPASLTPCAKDTRVLLPCNGLFPPAVPSTSERNAHPAPKISNTSHTQGEITVNCSLEGLSHQTNAKRSGGSRLTGNVRAERKRVAEPDSLYRKLTVDLTTDRKTRRLQTRYPHESSTDECDSEAFYSESHWNDSDYEPLSKLKKFELKVGKTVDASDKSIYPFLKRTSPGFDMNMLRQEFECEMENQRKLRKMKKELEHVQAENKKLLNEIKLAKARLAQDKKVAR